MSLEFAEWKDILFVLKDNFSIWSAGLTPSDYRTYLSRQIESVWLRKHFRYVVYKKQGKIMSSCKIYFLDFVIKQQKYRFAGLGAVYTQKHCRGEGFAKKMLELVIDDCVSHGLDGLLLFSDISPGFYGRIGFALAGGYDLLIDLGRKENFTLGFQRHLLSDLLQKHGINNFLSPDKISQMIRHHQRWLRRQPYGIERSEQYLLYKLAREKFLSERSKLNRPILNIFSLNDSPSNNEFAYAVTEFGSHTMRVLEVVGPESQRNELWSRLFALARGLDLAGISSWESLAKDLCPNFGRTVDGQVDLNKPNIVCYERTWGRPMILPINKELVKQSDNWLDSVPCPLLELDHL